MGPARGVRFGKYDLLGYLATGGMGQLHLARSSGIEGFEKLVVIKQVSPDLARSAEFVSLFLDEARLAARLHHPNIVQVFDAGVVAERYFFAMEFVHGEDARTILARARERGRPLTLAEALEVGTNLCSGLHHAHELRDDDGNRAGVVHRDVSPSNVLVSYDGGVKLTDFGIATAAGGGDEAGRTLRGKARYMSPEQLRGDPIDRRSDVFSLGLVLYELTTMAPGFRGDEAELAARRAGSAEIAPPSTHVPSYPDELADIVLRATATDPAQRQQTAQELQLELEAFAQRAVVGLSSIHVAELMTQLFEVEIRSWHAARSGGRLLADHLMESGTVSLGRPQVSPRAAVGRSRVLSIALATAIACAVSLAAAWIWFSSPNAAGEPPPRPAAAPAPPLDPVDAELAPPPAAPATSPPARPARAAEPAPRKGRRRAAPRRIVAPEQQDRAREGGWDSESAVLPGS